jgi:hypothetical protein
MQTVDEVTHIGGTVSFEYPASWILVTYPPMQPGGAFYDLHNGVSALESTPKEDTGLVTYKPGDFSLRLLVYTDGWAGSAYQTVRVEAQRLHQYHYLVSEPGRVNLPGRDAAQVVFGTRARDGAFIAFALDSKRWILASLSAAVGQLESFLPAAYNILQSVGLTP